MINIRRIAVGTTVALVGLAPATAAYARPSTTARADASAAAGANGSSAGSDAAGSSASGERWQQVHARVQAALRARVRTLSNLTTSVADSKQLTTSDQTALDNLLGPETTGINGLLQTVESATQQNTTIAQLRDDAKNMVDNYRVYLVMARQVHLTEAADAQTAVELTLSNDEPKIDAAIQKAGNPPQAVSAYNDLVTQVSSATTATGNADVPAVLQVTPSGYPGDGGPLTSASSDLHQAQTDLKAARSDLQIIKNVLTQNDSTRQSQSSSTTGSTGQ